MELNEAIDYLDNLEGPEYSFRLHKAIEVVLDEIKRLQKYDPSISENTTDYLAPLLAPESDPVKERMKAKLEEEINGFIDRSLEMGLVKKDRYL